jgi:F-type H+-transporting ATPase subunit delta
VRARELTARRYAKALFLSASEAGNAAEVGRDLEAFRALLDGHPEVRDVLSRPWIKGGDRHAIARGLAEKNGASQLVQNLVALVAERGRIDHLPEIVEAYRALADEALGQARAKVRSAVALTDQERRQLGGRLEHMLGKRIIVEEQVDSTLLGGFVAHVGGLIVDGSLDGQLARMRDRLVRG